ncbi:MAG: membrane protein insertion efficiency factor YidD [Ignavibacteriales bacterium]|nr:membrane protein insertion efficiency factor YidD [Ignavibacteriales bacterium]
MKQAFILIIRLYQRFISGLLPFNHCRFYPSCSNYSLEAIETHGFMSGFWLTIKRISKCHPFSTSNGYDPVP